MTSQAAGRGGSLSWKLRQGPKAVTVPGAYKNQWEARLRTLLPPLARALKADVQQAYAGTQFAKTFGYTTSVSPYVQVKLTQTNPIFPYVEFPTRPHTISAKTGPYLHFYWARKGRWVKTPSVRHPGTKGKHLVDPIFARYDPQFQALLRRAATEASSQ